MEIVDASVYRAAILVDRTTKVTCRTKKSTSAASNRRLIVRRLSVQGGMLDEDRADERAKRSVGEVDDEELGRGEKASELTTLHRFLC